MCHATWTGTAAYLPSAILSPHQAQSSDATTGLSSPALHTHVGPEAPGGQGARFLLAAVLGLEAVGLPTGELMRSAVPILAPVHVQLCCGPNLCLGKGILLHYQCLGMWGTEQRLAE